MLVVDLRVHNSGGVGGYGCGVSECVGYGDYEGGGRC